MNDGLIGRNKKLLKLVETLNLEGWDWLGKVKGAIQTGDDDTVSHRMSEVITGRPVLSMNKNIGGFRLRYGRCFNTGFATIGIHHTIPILLDNAVVVGTQIKMDVPGKASTIALIDTIEPPIVRLNDGTVLQISTKEQAENLKSQVSKILYLGDILISYGDFLENNAQLLPASYVEEIWALELFEKIKKTNETNEIDKNSNYLRYDRLVDFYLNPYTSIPSIGEAIKISSQFDVPLHPKYSFYWESINIKEFMFLRNNLLSAIKDNHGKMITVNFLYNGDLKIIFEKIGLFHSINDTGQTIILEDLSQTISLVCLCVPEIQSLCFLVIFLIAFPYQTYWVC